MLLFMREALAKVGSGIGRTGCAVVSVQAERIIAPVMRRLRMTGLSSGARAATGRSQFCFPVLSARPVSC
jgi:hypothetical protein